MEPCLTDIHTVKNDSKYKRALGQAMLIRLTVLVVIAYEVRVMAGKQFDIYVAIFFFLYLFLDYSSIIAKTRSLPGLNKQLTGDHIKHLIDAKDE